MPSTIRVAVAQSRVEFDVPANGEEIRRLMSRAAAERARVILFPEGALSAYVGPWRSEFAGWNVDWSTLETELAAVAALAGSLGVWVIVGSNWQVDGEAKPRNCLFVVDDTGTIVDRYDKRRLSAEEAAVWYTPGDDPVVVEVDGMRFGCATCIELTHADLFDDYADAGVDGFLVGAFTDDPSFVDLARGHAVDHGRWCLLSQASNCEVSSMVIDPTGQVADRAGAGSTLLFADIGRNGPGLGTSAPDVRTVHGQNIQER